MNKNYGTMFSMKNITQEKQDPVIPIIIAYNMEINTFSQTRDPVRMVSPTLIIYTISPAACAFSIDK